MERNCHIIRYFREKKENSVSNTEDLKVSVNQEITIETEFMDVGEFGTVKI